MVAMSVVIGAICALAGLYLSYYIDVSSGATIVLFSATLFVLALAYTAIRERLGSPQAIAVARAGRQPKAHGLFD
jgi:ABC-type Mn2+/Zn2+ transport system permease subunit